MSHRYLRYVGALVTVLLAGAIMARTELRPPSAADVRRHTSIDVGRYGIEARMCWRPTACTTLALEVTARLQPAVTAKPSPAGGQVDHVASPTFRMVELLLEIARWFLFACGPVGP